jgi:hypothetical protein
VHTIDIEPVTGEIGTYEVTWWIDEEVDNPLDDYDHLTSVVLRPRDWRSLVYSYGPMAEEVSRILADGTRSEASVLRWLALRGCRGIHTLYHSRIDGGSPPIRRSSPTPSCTVMCFAAPRLSSRTTCPR